MLAQLLITSQGARRLQDGRDRCLVVRGARGAEGRVVVRGEEHPAGRVAAGYRRDDVLHPSGDGITVESAGANTLLHLYVEPQCGQLGDQVVADLVAGGAADRGRLLTGDPPQVYPRALGTEPRLRCGRRHRPWRSFRHLRPHDESGKDKEPPMAATVRRRPRRSTRPPVAGEILESRISALNVNRCSRVRAAAARQWYLAFFQFLLQEDGAAVLVQEQRPDAPRVAVGFSEEPHAPLP